MKGKILFAAAVAAFIGAWVGPVVYAWWSGEGLWPVVKSSGMSHVEVLEDRIKEKEVYLQACRFEVDALSKTIADLKSDLDHYEKLRDTPSAEVWMRLCHAEMNVRYRDRVGDDGLRAEWAALRDKAMAAYRRESVSQSEADELYAEQAAISSKEPPEVDKRVIDAVCDEMDKEIEIGSFPPYPYKPATDAEWRQFQESVGAAPQPPAIIQGVEVSADDLFRDFDSEQPQ